MIDVTCAVIRNDEGLVLAVRRGPSMDNAGKWEFPGGKTLPGEDHEECIIREIKEELGITVIITASLDSVEYDYGDRIIRLIPFICDTLATRPHLTEHDEYRWMKPEDLVKLDLTAADIPVAGQYATRYTAVTEQVAEVPVEILTAEAGEELARMVGRITSVNEITMVAKSAVSDPVLLSQLVTLSSSHEKRVGFMASWALSKVADIDIEMLKPFLPSLIVALPDVANESVQRSFMRVITKSDLSLIPVSHHARLVEYCMGIMRTEQAAVAPKAYGMEILASFCEIYPDMVNEVAVVVQLAINDEHGGMKAAGRKVIARLKSN
ncbi:MAG: (deoxy)nucleoside triphosphate pyrophosphohydrolase [Bacteroidales bacterium]|nr:(deoxy)nucleoside triphosphate pyrophosphohydrolase [Bacteroidales bacterium]